MKRSDVARTLTILLSLALPFAALAQDEPCDACQRAWQALPARIVPVPLFPSASDFVWLAVFDPLRADPSAAVRVQVHQESPEARAVPANAQPWLNDNSGVVLGNLSPGTYLAEYFEPGASPVQGESPKASLRFIVSKRGLVSVIEYFNAKLSQYFMTADATEIEKLDSGVIPGWQRTGESFHAFAADEVPSFGLPVCRFYGLPSAGLGSHFFSASAEECAFVKANWPGQWLLETEAAFGTVASIFPFDCPQPLYRLYDNRPEANHRYTTSTAIRDGMMADGWILEAAPFDGPLAYEEPFTMCVFP